MSKAVPFAIFHIPHASTVIPPETRTSILLSEEALVRELNRMTDAFTDELFQVDSSIATPVVFPVSRLVVDPERYLDDEQEPMAKKGMGVVYTRTSDGTQLRQPGYSSERESLIADYYHPHHQRLAKAVQASLDSWGSCLLIDCHSFSSVPLPHERDQSSDRPDICLGTDEFHTPGCLVTRAVGLFESHGFRTLLNRPFSGVLVPEPFYRHHSQVRAIMVEVNRSLYMDDLTGERLPSFLAFKARFQGLLTHLSKRPGQNE